MAKKWTAAAVRRLRKQLGLTQEGLARKLDMTHVSVNRWEKGRSVPSKLAQNALDALAKGVS